MEVFLWTSCMSDKTKSVATLFCNLTSLSGMLFFMATCSDHLNFQGLPWDLLFSWRSPVACCLYLSVLLPLLPFVFVVYCLCYCFYSTCCSLCLRVLYSLSSRNISIYLIWKESLKFSQYSLVWMFLFFIKLLITLTLVQREDNTRIGLAGVEIMDCSVDWSLGTVIILLSSTLEDSPLPFIGFSWCMVNRSIIGSCWNHPCYQNTGSLTVDCLYSSLFL